MPATPTSTLDGQPWPPPPGVSYRPQVVPVPLACMWCGVATPSEGAEHPDDGSGWTHGWPGRRCPTCTAHDQRAGRSGDLSLMLTVEALGLDVDLHDPDLIALVREQRPAVRYCWSPMSGPHDRGHPGRWQHVPAELRHQLTGWLDARKVERAQPPRPHPDGLACAGCGTATARTWTDPKVGVQVAQQQPGRPTRLPLCDAAPLDPPTEPGQPPCATLLTTAGATGAPLNDALAAAAAGLERVPYDLAREVGFLPHAEHDPYGPGTADRWGYLGDDLDQLRRYVRRMHTQALPKAERDAIDAAFEQRRRADRVPPRPSPLRLQNPSP